jgi:hypothetical protein
MFFCRFKPALVGTDEILSSSSAKRSSLSTILGFGEVQGDVRRSIG